MKLRDGTFAGLTQGRAAKVHALPTPGSGGFTGFGSGRPDLSSNRLEPAHERARRDHVRHAHHALLERRLGRTLGALRRQEAWRALGFVRMADYVAERLGMGARSAQELIRTETALARLPRTAAAWVSGRITGGHLRILTRVATERTESWWLWVATQSSVAAFAESVARWKQKPDFRPCTSTRSSPPVSETHQDTQPCPQDEVRRTESLESPRGRNGSPAATLSHQESDRGTCAEAHPRAEPAPDIDQGEPDRIRLEMRAPAWIVVMWRQTCEHVRRMTGRRLHAGACLDLVLAEAQGTVPVGDLETPVHASRPGARASRATLSIAEKYARLPFDPDRPLVWRTLPNRETRREPRELDQELRALAGSHQREEADLACRLKRGALERAYLSEGFRNLESWARQRLDLSARRLYYLLALARALESLARLRVAFLEGRITMRKALLVGSVATVETEAAWIERASTITLRRLDDEVRWWRHLREVRPEVWKLLRGGPPPEGLVLVPGQPPRLHACAPGSEGHGGACSRSMPGEARNDSCDLDLHASAPSPITAARLLAALEAQEDAAPLPERSCRLTMWLDPDVNEAWLARCAACRHPSGEPMREWEVLALLMHGFLTTWDNEETRRQRREHATLERDGWRCTAPGCSSMGSGVLNEHHIVFRSHGGAARDPANLTTLCTAHHKGLLHGGLMRCRGEAPDGLTWELGTGGGREPFLVCRGDRIVGGTAM